MFLDSNSLQTQISQEHKEPQTLYIIKIKNVWWPAESVSVSKGEVITVKIFNNERNEVECNSNNSKEIKPFAPIDKIPKTRSKEWKTGYDKALDLFSSVPK